MVYLLEFYNLTANIGRIDSFPIAVLCVKLKNKNSHQASSKLECDLLPLPALTEIGN